LRGNRVERASVLTQGEEEQVAKEPNSGPKARGKRAKKPAKPVDNEANVEEFEREGMGVASKE
jgi:hypothetical protein